MLGARRILHEMESPFTWNCPSKTAVSINEFVKSNREKAETITNENDFQWTRSVLNLILAYELSSKLKDYPSALAYIDKCGAHIQELRLTGCKEDLFLNIKRPLIHVLLVTKAQILIDSGNDVEGQKVLSQLQPSAKALNHPKDRAGLLGLKAAMFIYYGTTGHRMALDCAQEASKLDPNEAEWHFIVGNAMGRIRRVENRELSCATEFKEVEAAYNLRKDGTYIVHLAYLYSEHSSFLYFNKDPQTNRVDISGSERFAVKAIERFKEALALRPDCSSTMARVAHGLIRIRHKKLLDMKFVKSLMERVVELAPSNCLVYHDLGFYYEKYENNNEKALANLKKADELGNIKALTYMISIKWKYGKHSEIITDILNGIDRYSEKDQSAELYATLGAAYILIEDNWVQGIKYLTCSLELDNSAKYLIAFHGFNGRRTNLLEMMINEVQNKAETEKNGTKLVFFNTFLKHCKLLDLKVVSRPINFQIWAKDQKNSALKKRV